MIKRMRRIHCVHFVGIGGSGMSGIAEVMLSLGYKVQGSDLKANKQTKRLENQGATVFIGHAAENIEHADAVVVSSAVDESNPEVAAARERLMPVVARAEMLAELMRLKNTVAVAGTHGKTTTTSMIAALLDAGGVDPTVINGGIINQYGSNARLGDSDWMVVEADESDGSFLRLDGTIAVVTNIDPEHLDHYGSFDRVKDAFVEFIENVPFYGAAMLCIDHPEVQGIIPKVRDRRVVTYGFSAQADVRGENVTPFPGGNRFDVVMRQRDGSSRRIDGIELPMSGRHNVQNALAAVAVAAEMGCPDDVIQTGFAKFGGVNRRFTRVGEWEGVAIIDDYGHHPVEMAATIAAARGAFPGRRLVLAFQPHRYTRTRDLFEDFVRVLSSADAVLLAEVYPAGEAPIVAADGRSLARAVRVAGRVEPVFVEDIAAMPAAIRDIACDGDVVITMGAGSIGGVPAQMKEVSHADG